METLNEQLNKITQAALLLIKDQLKKNNGVVTIFEGDRVIDDELTDDFLRSVPELNHYLELEGNEIMYPFLLNGDEHNCSVFCISESGTEHKIDLFEMDANNITLIADSLNAPKEEIDLFEHYEALPEEVQAILDKYCTGENDYENCANLVVALREIGYTCEYGLDAEPHNLRKL